MKDILVVTPTLGDRPTLEKTYTSVHEIGRDRIQHVIIAPNSRATILKDKFPKSIVIAEPATLKKGIYPSLNYAFFRYIADYKYLTYINDDDYWVEDFKILIDTVTENQDLDLVYGKTFYIDQNGRRFRDQSSYSNFNKFLPLYISGIPLLTQQATLIKADLFCKVSGFSEDFRLISDSKFWIDLSLQKINFKFVNKFCAAYMIQEGQLSSDSARKDLEKRELFASYKKYSALELFLVKLNFRLFNLRNYIK